MATKMYMAVYFTFGMTSLVLQVGMLCTTCSTVQVLLARPASRHLWSCKWVAVLRSNCALLLAQHTCFPHKGLEQRREPRPFQHSQRPPICTGTAHVTASGRHLLASGSPPTWLLLQIIRSLLLVLGSFSASKKLHRNLLARVMHLPMSFFDSQPTGRLLNRWAHPLKSMPFFQIAHKQDIRN